PSVLSSLPTRRSSDLGLQGASSYPPSNPALIPNRCDSLCDAVADFGGGALAGDFEVYFVADLFAGEVEVEVVVVGDGAGVDGEEDRKSTRLNSSHVKI